MKEKIVEYLINKYGAKGIILYGSRAQGKATDLSDWDIFIFSDKTENDVVDFGEINLFLGQQIDLSIYSTSVSDDFILDSSTHPIDGAVVLHDDLDGKMTKIVNNSNIAYQIGPKILTYKQKDLQRKILRKFLNKSESRPNDKASISFGVSQFYIFAVRYWFERQTRWPLPFYEAMEIIKKDDYEYFSNLEKLYLLEYSYQQKVQSMHRLYQLISEKQ